MKTNRSGGALLALALVLGTRPALAGDESKAKPGSLGVVVYVKQDNLLVAELGRAEATAARILAGVGVRLVFRAGAAPKSNREGTVRIELQLQERVSAQLHAGALAYAMPFGVSGTRILVFCDRVRNAWPDAGTGTVLGYVMAHEIGHVLEGVSRHSAEGIMKAHWDNPDYRQMKSATLQFDPSDAELIHSALEDVLTHSTRAELPPH